MFLLRIVSTLSLLLCSLSHAEIIPLKEEAGTFVVPVLINDRITLDFTLDSGASVVAIPTDVYSTLVRAGTVEAADVLNNQEFLLADGSKQRTQQFRIRSLKVGSLELRGVIATVVPQGGRLLLGQSFLSQLRSWSIDNQRKELLIDEPAMMSGVDHGQGRGDVQDANWVLLGRSYAFGKAHSGPFDYIDVSSIIIQGSIRRAWFKSVPEKVPTKQEYGKLSGIKLSSYDMDFMAFNCQDKTYRIEKYVSVFFDGTRDSSGKRSNSHFEVAIPESQAMFELKYICSWNSK